MMDPAKLKVVELRAELSKRGLDTKGNKAVLVERLRKALEEDTEDNAEEEVAAVNLSDDSPHKNAREKTPEPVPLNKSTGRSSRSSSATPTKASPVKSSPKAVLSPVPEKQASPMKSLAVERAPDEIDHTIETKKPEPAPVEEKVTTQEPEKQEEPPAPSCPVSEPVKELPTTQPIVPQPIVPEPIVEEPEKIQTQNAEPVEQAVEKASPLKEAKESVQEKEEEAPHAEEISNVCEVNREPDQPEETEPPKEPAAPEELVPEHVDEELPESEKMETDSGYENVAESKSDAMDQETVAGTEENDATENSVNKEEKSETIDDAPIEEKTDDKPNDENFVQPNEQDVEMKEAKIEAEVDADRDSKDHDKKDRKDRKRKRSASPQEEKAKSPPPSRAVDEPELNKTDVVLSWYDSDLNLMINKENFVSATAMHNDGFGYVWAGARATFGFTEGKVYYEAKITEYCDINLQDEQSPHVLRVGWSVQGTSMQLGEEPLSYGFDGTGKISTGNDFSDYGATFGKDDVVGCYVDFSDESNFVISYTINGKDLGSAFTVLKNDLDGKPLYPHVLTKNCTFACNFGQEQPWSENILDGYTPAGLVDLQNRVNGPRRPEKTEECEIIMMCGLPAAGKTVWATKYAENNREKMYNILGISSLIEKMKVLGLPRGRNSQGKWESFLEKCSKCLNKLVEMASTRRRNYILDQSNIYASAQRRKMRSFHGYQRRAVVVVPTEEELKARAAKRDANDCEIPSETSILDMKANFSAPVTGEIFDSVEWTELPAEEGKKLIEKYNKEGKEAGYGQQPTNKRPRFERNESQRDSRDSRPNNRDVRDNRDHRDRRNNYSDRNRNSTWRGGNSSGGGWRDRPNRPSGGHARHSNSGSGYGGSSGGWRGRSSVTSVSSYRQGADRRVSSGHDRRSSAIDRNRSTSSRQGGWGSMNSYGSSQQQSSGWGGSSQSGSWQGQSQQQGWGNQSGSWSQQQQWGSWKSYGQGNNYSQGSYSQQGYGNGNWSGWNPQYYNQYWGQQQSTGQTSAAGSQAGSTSSTTPTGNSTASTGSTYSSYSTGWQDYRQPYGYSVESSSANTQQQK